MNDSSISSMQHHALKTNKPHHKYRNIIFDLGGVLIYFKPNELAAAIFNDQQRQALPEDFVHAIASRAWLEMDRGTMTRDEVCDALADRFPRAMMEQFMAHLPHHLNPMPTGEVILHAIQQRGFATYILSNMSDWAHHVIDQKTDLFKRFDGAVFSYQVNLVKPEPQIYKLLLTRYQLKAEECLFIDDLEHNINAAKALGIDGIICHDHDQLRGDLKKMAVLD